MKTFRNLELPWSKSTLAIMLLLVPFLAACGSRKELQSNVSYQEQKDSSQTLEQARRIATYDSHRATEWSEELTELFTFEIDTATGKAHPRIIAAKRHTKRGELHEARATQHADTTARKSSASAKSEQKAQQTYQKRTQRNGFFRLVDMAFGWLLLLPFALAGISLWKTRKKWLEVLKKVFNL